ncbi:MAG: acetylxylan esterase, partial [Acidobacteriota bacterium]
GGPAAARGGGPTSARGGGGAQLGEPPVAADIIARGWGYATVGYLDIQPDRANAWNQGVIGLTLAPGQQQPAPGEWGTIGAWAWGVSRIIDYLETDKQVNAKKIAL